MSGPVSISGISCGGCGQKRPQKPAVFRTPVICMDVEIKLQINLILALKISVIQSEWKCFFYGEWRAYCIVAHKCFVCLLRLAPVIVV